MSWVARERNFDVEGSFWSRGTRLVRVAAIRRELCQQQQEFKKKEALLGGPLVDYLDDRGALVLRQNVFEDGCWDVFVLFLLFVFFKRGGLGDDSFYGR